MFMKLVLFLLCGAVYRQTTDYRAHIFDNERNVWFTDVCVCVVALRQQWSSVRHMNQLKQVLDCWFSLGLVKNHKNIENHRPDALMTEIT